MKLSDDEMLERMKAALHEAHDFETVATVVEKVKAGLWQWHQVGDGVIITSISANQKGEKYLHGHFIFGDLEDVLSQSDKLDDFGRAEGCKAFIMDGRTGWTRTLKPLGWKPIGVILKKDLTINE